MRAPTFLPVFLAVVTSLSIAAHAAAQSRLLRFPDVHGDRVVFTYGGDLWLAPAAAAPRRG